MLWSRAFTWSLSVAFLVLAVAPAAAAREADPIGATVPVQWSDEAPEEWIVGERRIEGADESVAARYRVLPGGHLIVRDSTLRFLALDGLGGIVAEPGGEVTIERSTLVTEAPGSFMVHLEGPATLAEATVTGAAYVVLQPRATTDHADDALSPVVPSSVPEWRIARALTMAVQDVQGLVTDAPLTVGVPQAYSTPVDAVPLRLRGLDVDTATGPALACYETEQSPDLHDDFPLIVGERPTALTIEASTFAAASGNVVWCAAQPGGKALPDRNPPSPLPNGLGPLLPPPPRPEVRRGPDSLSLIDVTVRGGEVGVLLDWPLELAALRLGMHDLLVGMHVEGDATVTLTDAVATGVDHGVYVEDGSFQDIGGDYTGRGTGVGEGVVVFDDNDASLTGTALRGFARTVLDAGGMVLTDVDLEASAECLFATRPTHVTGSRFTECDTGISLFTSGATITGNTFASNADPLRILATAPLLSLYQHTVSGNTVNGRSLAYVVGQTDPAAITAPVGHAVVAFSEGVRLSDVSVDHGKLHIVESDDVVIGAKAANAPAVLGDFDPDAVPGLQRVHDEVRFAPYPGSLLGPQGPLDAGYANDVDAAWALADLWRAEGRTVRFVDGTQSGDTEDFLRWVGMEHAGYAFAMDGIEASWFGDTYSMQRTWLELEVGPGVWFEADPIYNQYDWSEPVDVQAAMGYDDDAVVAATMDGAAMDYVHHGASALDLDALFAVQQDYNATAMPVVAPGDAPDGGDLFRIPTARAFGAEDDVTRTPASRYADIPASRMWTTRLTTKDLFTPLSASAHIAFETDLSRLYGHRVTVEAFPDTPAMSDALTAAGGLYDIDRNSMTFTTFLKVDGEIQDFIGGINTAAPDGVTVRSLPTDPADRPVRYKAGDLVGLDIEIRRPGGALYAVHDSPFRVGGTYAVVFDLGGTPKPLLDRRIADYNETLDTWGFANESLVDHGDLLGELYHIQGMSYFRQLHDTSALLAAQNDVLEIPLASVAVTGTSVVPIIDGGVHKVAPTPPYFDIRGVAHSYPIEGDIDKLFDHRFASGVLSSALEDKTFTHMYDLPAVSTIKALSVAADQGIGIYHLNATTPEALSILELPDAVMQSVVDAINRGWEVIVPKTEITYYNWTGVGWLELDVETGSAGWLIYGGTAPPTGSLAIDEWPILSGGAGAQYTRGYDGKFFDWGYEDDFLTAIDWTDKGVGFISGSAETAFRYSTINGAGNWARIQLDGVALNNYHRSLAGKWDIPGRYGSFVGKAGNAVAVVGHAADMWSIANSDATVDSKIGQMVGVTAINVATVAGGAAVIKGMAAGGALVGGAVFDGPGLVAGAIVGGILGAVGLGIANHYAKKGWRSLF